jgi:hypothetical protein
MRYAILITAKDQASAVLGAIGTGRRLRNRHCDVLALWRKKEVLHE